MRLLENSNIYEEIYSSDLIISRCGASSLAEIQYFKKFCILQFGLGKTTYLETIDLERLYKYYKSNSNKVCLMAEQPEGKNNLFGEMYEQKARKQSKKTH